MEQGTNETVTQSSHVITHEGDTRPHPWLPLLKRASLFNCFWLIVPVLLWNLLFTLPGKYSPGIFWHNIPPLIAYGENIFRTVVILFPLLMP